MSPTPTSNSPPPIDASATTPQPAPCNSQTTPPPHNTPLYAKAWGRAWLLALLIGGTAAYGLHHPRPIEPDKAPDFNALIYTLDLLLPIIDFGQEKAFNPHGPYQWLAYLLIAAGWILATTVVAGITRAVSRQ